MLGLLDVSCYFVLDSKYQKRVEQDQVITIY